MLEMSRNFGNISYCSNSNYIKIKYIIFYVTYLRLESNNISENFIILTGVGLAPVLQHIRQLNGLIPNESNNEMTVDVL